jgi:hypothetical protein
MASNSGTSTSDSNPGNLYSFISFIPYISCFFFHSIHSWLEFDEMDCTSGGGLAPLLCQNLKMFPRGIWQNILRRTWLDSVVKHLAQLCTMTFTQMVFSSSHHITSHHITSHHITSHHITSHLFLNKIPATARDLSHAEELYWHADFSSPHLAEEYRLLHFFKNFSIAI